MKKKRTDVPPSHQLGDAPIEDAYTAKMTFLMREIDHMFNGDLRGPERKTGIVLLVFPFSDKGRCNFMSNGADRRDIVTLFREMIARFEGQPEMKGSA